MGYQRDRELRDRIYRVADRSRDGAVREAKEMHDELVDILIEAGILELSLDGEYTFSTDNYTGRFDVRSLPARTGTPPGSRRK